MARQVYGKCWYFACLGRWYVCMSAIVTWYMKDYGERYIVWEKITSRKVSLKFVFSQRFNSISPFVEIAISRYLEVGYYLYRLSQHFLTLSRKNGQKWFLFLWRPYARKCLSHYPDFYWFPSEDVEYFFWFYSIEILLWFSFKNFPIIRQNSQKWADPSE